MNIFRYMKEHRDDIVYSVAEAESKSRRVYVPAALFAYSAYLYSHAPVQTDTYYALEPDHPCLDAFKTGCIERRNALEHAARNVGLYDWFSHYQSSNSDPDFYHKLKQIYDNAYGIDHTIVQRSLHSYLPSPETSAAEKAVTSAIASLFYSTVTSVKALADSVYEDLFDLFVFRKPLLAFAAEKLHITERDYNTWRDMKDAIHEAEEILREAKNPSIRVFKFE